MSIEPEQLDFPEKASTPLKRKPKDQRLREQLFPGAEDIVFSTSEKGFIPVAILYRKLLRYLSPPQSRILLYLQLRASRFSICYPTLEEIAHDLGLSSRKKLTPHLNALIENGFISTASSSGKKFFLINHPRIPAIHLRTVGRLKDDAIAEIDELLEDLGQAAIEWPKTGGQK